MSVWPYNSSVGAGKYSKMQGPYLGSEVGNGFYIVLVLLFQIDHEDRIWGSAANNLP